MSGRRRPFFRQLRIAVLMLILAGVALDIWLQRSRTQDWDKREWVAVYPIAGDNSPATGNYVENLQDRVFEPVEDFFAAQSAVYGIDTPAPIDLQLRERLHGLPPAPPSESGALKNALWSLRMRYWAWQITRHDPKPETRISLFLVYHDPSRNQDLPHSVGLRELLLGVVHVFAERSQQPANNFVIAHELMHTLGATDKYDSQDNQPVFPHGFAEPDKEPLYPQRFAEVMGGRIPISPDRAQIPPGLKSATVGTRTEAEIGWIR